MKDVTIHTCINVDTKYGFVRTNHCPFGKKTEDHNPQKISIIIDRIVFYDNNSKINVIFHSFGVYEKIVAYLIYEDNSGVAIIKDIKKSNDASDILIDLNEINITRQIKYIALRDVNSPFSSAKIDVKGE